MQENEEKNESDVARTMVLFNEKPKNIRKEGGKSAAAEKKQQEQRTQ